jgi:AcrR family transcriptional regulator
MVVTPWGDSSELRDRKLRPGAGKSREEVVRNQRERIFGAVVAIAAEKGYEAMTIADVVEVSGVSRSDFYEHFSGKEECLVAAVDALVDPTLATISKAKALAGEDQVREAFEAFIRLAVWQAAASRLAFVESYVAGAKAEAAISRAFDAFAEFVGAAMRQIPDREKTGPELVRAVLGGLQKILHTRFYRGEEGELAELAPEIWQWGLSYYPPPEPLRAPRRQRLSTQRFGGYTVAQQISRAAAAVIAEQGYRQIGAGEIAARASISLSTFYAHFANKEEAMLAAMNLGGELMLATVAPVARGARDWRTGVRGSLEALLAFLAAEPDFARLLVTEVYAAGPRALAERDRIIDSLRRLMAPAYAEAPQAPKIAGEAIAGAVYSILYDQLRRESPEKLPEIAPLITYMTLTPFLGAAEACAVANGDGRRR